MVFGGGSEQVPLCHEHVAPSHDAWSSNVEHSVNRVKLTFSDIVAYFCARASDRASRPIRLPVAAARNGSRLFNSVEGKIHFTIGEKVYAPL